MVPEFIQVTQLEGHAVAIPIHRIISISDNGTCRVILLDHHTADEALSVKCSTPLAEISKQIGEARDAIR